MATRSYILVEVKDEDIRKTIKPNYDLIKSRGLSIKALETYEEINRTEFEKIPALTIKRKYLGIYCHWDGDPNWTGKGLYRAFNSYEKALNLMTLGAMSSVFSDAIKPYAVRDGIYKKENYETAGQTKEIPRHMHERTFAEYAYLYRNGQWEYTETYKEEYNWRPLKDYFENKKTE